MTKRGADPVIVTEREGLFGRLKAVRAATERLAAPLSPEDQTVQSMPDASPTKWHRAHTTWFFETFVLVPLDPSYEPLDPRYGYLFNSYYEQVGARHPRPQRGVVTRPGAAEVGAYRTHVDGALARLAERADESAWARAAPLIELGLHHEMQHQELILMDIKHAFSLSALDPAYAPAPPARVGSIGPHAWVSFDGGLVEIGHDGDGFAFDNEGPRHRVHLEPFRLGSRLVTNGAWLEFMADGGYDRPELWLSDGWGAAQAERWDAPLYWRREAEGFEPGAWSHFTLAGRRALDLREPVSHVSYYEADAFARWAGARLPSEAEWEVAAADRPIAGNFLESGELRPRPAADSAITPAQLHGDLWEWTQSPYSPYPGYRAPEGAVGEYNGKFMVNQMVLKGGACVTPIGQMRASYRNFFHPHTRWHFSGVRLARDA
jgi:ergothioneine biosynthesis protein EgtB